jgi:protein-tyrosine phosphatase
MEDFLSRRQESFEILKPYIPEGIQVCLGAEVYITDIIMNNTSVRPVCYGNSNYILLEFPYSTSFEGSSYDFLIRFMNLYGVKPILAHIERYDALMRNPDILEDLASYGVGFQTNAISYLNKSTFRRFKKLIKNGLIHYIGSDAHNMVRNSPDKFKEATELISAKTSPNVIRAINRFSQTVFDKALR